MREGDEGGCVCGICSEREGLLFWGMLPNCSSNGRRARTHTKAQRNTRNYLSIPIPPYKMAHTLSCRRVVSRWLCLGNADTTRLASSFAITRQSEVGRGGQNCVLCIFCISTHLFIQLLLFCFFNFRLLCTHF